MNDVTFGIIVAGRIRDGGRRVAEVNPNRPNRRIYSAFLSKDNLLFILSARSKQELENLLRLGMGLCTIYTLPLQLLAFSII